MTLLVHYDPNSQLHKRLRKSFFIFCKQVSMPSNWHSFLYVQMCDIKHNRAIFQIFLCHRSPVTLPFGRTHTTSNHDRAEVQRPQMFEQCLRRCDTNSPSLSHASSSGVRLSTLNFVSDIRPYKESYLGRSISLPNSLPRLWRAMPPQRARWKDFTPHLKLRFPCRNFAICDISPNGPSTPPSPNPRYAMESMSYTTPLASLPA